MKLAPFADAEKVAKHMLEDRMTFEGVAIKTVTETPDTIDTPTIEVQKIPSDRANDGVTDFPMIRATVFGSTRAMAWVIAREMEQVVMASPRTVVTIPEDGVECLIDNAEIRNGLVQESYETNDIRPVSMAFRLSLRRPKEI